MVSIRALHRGLATDGGARDRVDIAWRRRWWLWPGAAAQEAHHSDSGIRRQARRCVGTLLQRVIVILGEVGGHALLGRLLQHHLLESFVQGNVQEVRDQPDALALVLQASELVMQARPPWLCAWLHVCTHGMCAYGMRADGGCGVGTKHGYQARRRRRRCGPGGIHSEEAHFATVESMWEALPDTPPAVVTHILHAHAWSACVCKAADCRRAVRHRRQVCRAGVRVPRCHYPTKTLKENGCR